MAIGELPDEREDEALAALDLSQVTEECARCVNGTRAAAVSPLGCLTMPSGACDGGNSGNSGEQSDCSSCSDRGSACHDCIRRCTQCIAASGADAEDADASPCSACDVCSPWIPCALVPATGNSGDNDCTEDCRASGLA